MDREKLLSMILDDEYSIATSYNKKYQIISNVYIQKKINLSRQSYFDLFVDVCLKGHKNNVLSCINLYYEYNENDSENYLYNLLVKENKHDIIEMLTKNLDEDSLNIFLPLVID